MEYSDRELHIAQIVADIIPVEIDASVYFLRSPSAESVYFANRIYKEVYEDAKRDGVFQDDQLYKWLLANQFWTLDQEKELKNLGDDIPKIKKEIYKKRLTSNDQAVFKKALKDTRNKIESLLVIKTAFDHLTCSGLASSAKFRFIIGSSITSASGKPYWRNPWKNWSQSDRLLDRITAKTILIRLDEHQMRELARSNPWREMWYASDKSGRGLFDRSSSCLTSYQLSLVMFSRFYDNIFSSPECPPETVVEDDDCLDGWMLIQKEKEEAETLKENILNDIGNDDIKNSSEVFLMANTREDAEKIQSINEPEGMMAFKSRMKQIKEEGEVSEVNLHETRLRLNMQAAQMFSDSLKKG